MQTHRGHEGTRPACSVVMKCYRLCVSAVGRVRFDELPKPGFGAMRGKWADRAKYAIFEAFAHNTEKPHTTASHFRVYCAFRTS